MPATYSNIKARVLDFLSDGTAYRVTADLTEEATLQALDVLDHHTPQMLEAEITVAIAGKMQSLATLDGLINITEITYPFTTVSDPTYGLKYTFYYAAGVPYLYFLGIEDPAVGEKIKVKYYARHTIDGLSGETTTTIPDELISAFIQGISSYCCRLRAIALVEAYGDRTAEIPSLLDQAEFLMGKFLEYLADYFVKTSYGNAPQGFRLDKWDRN
jgi:hypothetical protein